MEINSVNVVEKNPVPKSQTKPFYIGTKEAPSDYALNLAQMSIKKAVMEITDVKSDTMIISQTFEFDVYLRTKCNMLLSDLNSRVGNG